MRFAILGNDTKRKYRPIYNGYYVMTILTILYDVYPFHKNNNDFQYSSFRTCAMVVLHVYFWDNYRESKIIVQFHVGLII